ncbi:hypothetical protein DL764_004690 [Monosporascus ibericus]|uniref:Tyrosinase copper-binding domain-containing protein n=1 Tax=Monosporascus ibericus TaxID=155417 RepID=A0A4Q4TEY4_9PEZI|nr:hypothetical protein DL764_004690 [Monosporascus ibericus]
MPASTSRFMDFTASHAIYSLNAHISGTLLSWHREFVYLFERDLHEQCGYPRYLGVPYWDWPRYTHRPMSVSALFDGSDDSLGSNGVYIPDNANNTSGEREVPGGTGGGCVHSGPFRDHILTFGPFHDGYIITGLPSNWTEPNPRCFTRDLSDEALRSLYSPQQMDAAFAARDIEEFQFVLTPNGPGIHAGGHRAVGGPMTDFFASPQDPVFFLHHAQLDRVWALWQAADESRRYTYNGTNTVFNPVDGTPQVTNETVMSFSVIGEDVTLEEVADPMRGRYCYTYV